MDRFEWDGLFGSLAKTLDIVSGWAPEDLLAGAVRCEQSRHRTLAHLRACQEQWLVIVDAFLARDNPSVTVLHPWRKFDQGGYAELLWDDHLAKYLEDRRRWLQLQHVANWNRGGKWNRKPDTVGGLTNRLANHEVYHIERLLVVGHRAAHQKVGD